MTKKSWISVKIGMIDPKHQKAIGSAVWLFLYILDNADWETGIVEGYTDKQAGNELGIPKDTIIKHRRKLQAGEYITCKKNDYDQTITIHNWTDPRKYSGKILNPPNVGEATSGQSDQSDHERSVGSDSQSDQQTDQQSDHERSVSLKESSSNTKDQESNKPSGLKSKITKQEYDAWKYAGVPFGMFQGEIDVSHFPADVTTTIERFVRLWGVPVPPAKTGQYADWIKGARALMTAYGNYGPELMDLVFWKGGTKDMTIGRPASLVQFVSDMHGQLFRKRTHRDKLLGLIEHAKANTENGQRLIESVEEKQKALREELGLKDDEFLQPSS